jgi:hypothetical protein
LTRAKKRFHLLRRAYGVAVLFLVMCLGCAAFFAALFMLWIAEFIARASLAPVGSKYAGCGEGMRPITG